MASTALATGLRDTALRLCGREVRRGAVQRFDQLAGVLFADGTAIVFHLADVPLRNASAARKFSLGNGLAITQAAQDGGRGHVENRFGQHGYRSSGVRPVWRAMRASMRGPISSWSWKENT